MPRVYPPIEGRGNSNISPSLVESVAGFSAGIVSTLAVHPFDVVKTRLQINLESRAQVGDTVRIVKDIIQNEGSYKALYRGLMPNMIGNSVSWGLYFMWYGNIKDLVRRARGEGDRLTSADYFLASGASGILTAVFTNPIWVIKTRMLSTGKNAPGAYQSIAHGTKELWQTEGLKGFYRGLTPSLFGVSHGAIQFMAYEQLKNSWSVTRGGKDKLTNGDFLLLSATSKMFAGSVTYPYQVVRSRLQIYNAGQRYSSARDVIKQVFKKEGIWGFYRGLGPNLIRVLPSTCVTFLVYENTKFYLPRFFDEDKDDPGDD
ncbi:mitochondrial carrier domain-containing protein [Elsinoe ampelina]|uniref:Mitochondrial carrier domain-containing protein n=1 Tax=Elsinoe ampelina TaxID=302913 RepID=A0A6A6FZJ5_9PEZI|nr:mitochondrial carrier domain-containing protein [Elsinoe ampelina]